MTKVVNMMWVLHIFRKDVVRYYLITLCGITGKRHFYKIIHCNRCLSIAL